MVVKMSSPGARSVAWRSTACTIRGCRGRPTIPRARSGWSGPRPATWATSEGERAARIMAATGGGVPGVETPGGWGSDGAQAGEAGVPLFAELGQG